MHAPPPHVSPAGLSPAHRGASPTHLPPPASSGPHPAYSGGQPSSAADDRARIAVLESTVNQLATTMVTNMAELMALLKGPNRASSSFTPSPGYGPAVNPSPWAQPTLIHDNGDTSASTIVNAPAAHPVNNLPAPPSFSHPANLPAVTLIPSATMLEPPILVPPPISTLVPVSVSASVPAPTSAIPPSIIFLPITAQAPAHTAEPPPYQALQPHIGLSYQAPPPINIAYSEPGTPTHAAPRAPPTNFLPETGTEQEQRLKKLEENIQALQSSGSRLDAGDGDWSLFPGMQLPPKIKYWDYEEFVIHTFQDSLAGAALDWYMSLKAADIPTWADLSSKFIDQYRPPDSRTLQPVQRVSAPQDQQGIATQTRRKQFIPLPTPLSHIYRQLLAETGVGYAGFDATPTPFMIEVPAREPYQDSKVPWTYEGSVGNLERQFSVMGVTRSGRVYENPEAANKGKAPAVALGIALEAMPIP
ncbi:hypothetical protein CRG98_021585 [Punica granatum]|uniref:Retrotransposon gag domain-containing protein n=1 Tax=Punica granatum TaxID=22663 RepID=A0A2I0JNY6_PUNGR|nr:hypothetical protein CRG98_021585 [Punica granatum]